MVEQELDLEQWRETFLNAIEATKKKHKWIECAEHAMNVYRGEREDGKPVYHANLANAVQVQQGAILTQVPEVVCQGNNELSYSDDELAQVTEKILKHYIDENDLGAECDKFTASVFASSNGTIRVNDDLTFTMVNHENMLFEPCADWAQCGWVAFKHYYSRGVYVDEWGEPDVEGYEELKNFKVWEVWDKTNGKVWWLSEAKEEPLSCEEPVVKFKGFFPIPKPMLIDCKTTCLEPVVEYTKWKHLDEQVQIIAHREKLITKAIKAGYFYDSHVFGDLSKIEFTEDTHGHPVNGAMYQNGTQMDVNKAISYYDNSQYIQTLQVLSGQRQSLQLEIDKTIGLSGEMQQISTPNETATAQRIKQGYGSARLELKRRGVHRVIRDTIRLLAEAIVSVEDIKVLSAIAGKDVSAIIMNNITQGLIAYEIDIETQTSIAINQKDERADKMEFLQTFATVAERFTPLIDSGKMDMKTLAELMKMVTSSFPSSRSVDDNIDKLPELHNIVQQLQGQLQQLGQQSQQQAMDLQAYEQENMALKAQLDNATQIDLQKKVSEMEKINAEKELKIAELTSKNVDTIQKANQMTVMPNAMQDEMIGMQYVTNSGQPATPFNP